MTDHQILYVGSRDYIRFPSAEALGIRIVGLDADESCAEDGSETAALYSEPSDAQLHLTQDRRWSSLFKPSALFDRFLGYSTQGAQSIEEVVPVRTTTLDSFFSEECPASFSMVINAQGASPAILDGARRSLKNCFVVIAETEFVRLYDGQRTFGDCFNSMEQAGFRLLDINCLRGYGNRAIDVYKTNNVLGRGSLLYSDAIFVNDSFFLNNSGIDPIVPLKFLVHLGFLQEALHFATLLPGSANVSEENLITEAKSLAGKPSKVFRLLPKRLRAWLMKHILQLSHSNYLSVDDSYHHFKDVNRLDWPFRY